MYFSRFGTDVAMSMNIIQCPKSIIGIVKACFVHNHPMAIRSMNIIQCPKSILGIVEAFFVHNHLISPIFFVSDMYFFAYKGSFHCVL